MGGTQGQAGGTQGQVGGNPGIMWGPRQPVVVSRAWNCVDGKVELMTTEAAKGVVIWGLVYSSMRRTVHVAVGSGGASVARCKSTVFYRTPAPIIVYYFPYITCLLYLLFLIKHVRTSG